MATKKQIEIGFVAAIITENLFEQIYKEVNAGAIATYEKISMLACEFIEEHKGIKDWDKYLTRWNITDYEEAVLNWIRKHFELSRSKPLCSKIITITNKNGLTKHAKDINFSLCKWIKNGTKPNEIALAMEFKASAETKRAIHNDFEALKQQVKQLLK